jgi:hypothetical protein
MVAFSYSKNRGTDGFRQIDFTHGSLAPNANDIELRINQLDQNGVLMTSKDIFIALEAFVRALKDETMFGSDWGV